MKTEDATQDGLEALDAMAVAKDHHVVLLENDQVRVLDACVPSGETTPVHTHRWPGVLYVLSWSDFVRYDAAGNVIHDSRTMGSTPERGATLWSQPLGPHFVKNVGDADLHVIAVELKTPSLA